MGYRLEGRAEDVTPKQWYRDLTQHWSYQAKEIARAVSQTPQDQTINEEEKKKWRKSSR